MSNFLSDQFNNEPVSTTRHVTSYTIPNGGYARIRVTDLQDDFKIDGDVVISKKIFKDSSAMTSAGIKFTNNTEYVLVGSISKDGSTGFVDVSVVSSGDNITIPNPMSGIDMTIAGTPAGSIGVVISPGQRIFQNNSSPSGSFRWNLGVMDTNYTTEFWVPEGTLIEGTKFVVELYNKQGA